MKISNGIVKETSKRNFHPHVSVIILTYNQKENTIACIRSFQSVDYPNKEIFVVDNASTDGTAEKIEKEFPFVHLLRSSSNLGVSGGRNFGIEQALNKYSTGYILSIDNDTEVKPDFLDQLIATANEHEDTGIVTPKILNFYNRQIIDAAGNEVNLFTGKTPTVGYGEKDVGQYDAIVFLKAASGCCQFIPVEVWRQLKGYDTDFHPYGYEDLDLCLRARALGKKILLSSNSLIYHKKTQTIGSGKYVSSYTSIKGKNLRRFLTKHAKLHHKMCFFIIAPFLAFGSIFRAIRSGDPLAAFRLVSSFFIKKEN